MRGTLDDVYHTQTSAIKVWLHIANWIIAHSGMEIVFLSEKDQWGCSITAPSQFCQWEGLKKKKQRRKKWINGLFCSWHKFKFLIAFMLKAHGLQSRSAGWAQTSNRARAPGRSSEVQIGGKQRSRRDVGGGGWNRRNVSFWTTSASLHVFAVWLSGPAWMLTWKWFLFLRYFLCWIVHQHHVCRCLQHKVNKKILWFTR